VLVSVNV
jgi:U3 small nucleolar RNA-associated protein 4